MSVTHPLLKEFKGRTLRLLESEKPITDDNEELAEFCESLEKIFSRGVVQTRNSLGLSRNADSWYWLEEVAGEPYRAPYSYRSSVESSKKCPKVSTNRGRTRLLLRKSLVRRCLHVPVEIIMERNALPRYYTSDEVLGDEILAEMFLAVLKLLARVEFRLDVNRSRFLDDTWLLPDSVYLRLVPSAHLGISVMFVDDKAIVYDVAPDGVAAETENIHVGDVLDDLDDLPITDNVQGAVGNLIKKCGGRPISAHILKAQKNGDMFPPIVALLQQAGLDPPTLLNKTSTEQVGEAEEVVSYLGEVSTGSKCDVKEINKAIERKVKEPNRGGVPVLFDYHDLQLDIIHTKTQEVILKYSYLEISSCGVTTSSPTYFAFIAGDKSYRDCKSFKCHIFHCANRNEVDNLLKNIAQGFKRTHCAA